MAKRHRIQKDERNGNYFVRIQVAGTRKYFNLGPHLKEARRELARLEKRIARGEEPFSDQADTRLPAIAQGATAGHASHRDPFLSEVIATHLKWVTDNRAPATAGLYKLYEEYFLEFVGDRPVSTITRLMLEDFFTWGRDHHSKSENGGIVFVRHVKTMFLWAEEMDICPCPVRKFPKVTETPPATKRFSDEELRKLLSTVAAEFSDFRDMIVFGLHTGLRPQELRELTRSQLHDDGNGNYAVFIQHHKTAKSAHEPKPRSVPLTPDAKEIALRHLAAHPKSEFVFLNGKGGPYTKSVFRNRLLRWCRRAGIKPRPPYALRHTFGSIEAEANVNQTVIAQMMGHTQLRTTSRYIANNAEHHRVAINAAGSRIAKLGTILLLLASSVHAACFTGRVERVIDGDTIIVGTNRVRLAEIDAPEMRTESGPAAKKALSDMILGKTVRVDWSRRGRYRRIIGQVYLRNQWINKELVAQGWARPFWPYLRSSSLVGSEQTARRRGLGIWAQDPQTMASSEQLKVDSRDNITDSSILLLPQCLHRRHTTEKSQKGACYASVFLCGELPFVQR